MQASASEKVIISSNKKPKKRYQKPKGNDKKENNTLFETKCDSCVGNNESKTNSLELVYWKDFPELKTSGKLNTKSDIKSLSGEANSVKSWSTAVKGQNKNYGREAFPLSVVGSIRKDTVISNAEKRSESTNIISGKKDQAASEINYKITVEKNVRSKECDTLSQKNIPAQAKKNPLKKKRADPVLINFQDILAINNTLKRQKRRIIKSKTLRHKDKELLSGNILDSSNPKRSRGKQREIKKKKLSKFKTTILKERFLKHKIRETIVSNPLDCESLNLINETDFKAEVKAYLTKLSERKVKTLEFSKNKISEKTNVESIEKEKQENTGTQNNEDEKPVQVKKQQISDLGKEIKFSSKFREYCDNFITPELNASVTKLIKEIIVLQDRLFLRDPIKAKARKRHVSGFREVKKYLTLKKVKMIIIAPNLEKLQMEGSIYDSVNELKLMAIDQNIPYVFALDRYKLGKCTKKNVPVSAFAILNYEGLENLYENVLSQLLEAKKQFSEQLVPRKVLEEKEKINDVTSVLLSNLVSNLQEGLKMSSKDQTQLN